MFKYLKRTISAVAIVIMMATLALGAFSYFTDYAAISVDVVAGTLDISLSNVTEDLTGGSGSITPGESNPLTFTINNDGEKSADVKTIITITSSRAMTAVHEFMLTDTEGNELPGSLSADGSTLTYTLDTIILNGSVETEDGITERSHTYNYNFVMSADAADTFQGVTATLDIKVSAKQHNNTQGFEDSEWVSGLHGSVEETTLAAGLYETGTNYGTLVYSWDELLANNILTVTGGAVEYGVESAIMGDLVIASDVTSIGDYAFYNCGSLTSVAIPDGVTSIGAFAFGGCSSLTSVAIPDGVTSIGTRAFQNCSGLTSVVIPDSVTSIGEYAFYYCGNLASVVIPDGVEAVKAGSFRFCEKLVSVVIPDGVTSIGEYAFGSCYSLTSVVIPDGVTSIESGAFAACSGLTSIVIPDGVTSIGDYAFYNCGSLTSVVIPDGVTSIGKSTFDSCSSMTSVVIPDSVASIGKYAFYGCGSLTDVYFAGAEEQWNAISVGSNNESLDGATIHYNYVAE